jgi:CHC2-type zinc finger protein
MGVLSATPLLELFRSQGHEFKKEGKSYKTHCPFHRDDTPSLSVEPAKGLWHCFGCGVGGDGITFLEKSLGLTFGQAADQWRELPRSWAIPRWTRLRVTRTRHRLTDGPPCPASFHRRRGPRDSQDCTLSSRDSHRSGHQVGAVIFWVAGRTSLWQSQAKSPVSCGTRWNKGFRSIRSGHERFESSRESAGTWSRVERPCRLNTFPIGKFPPRKAAQSQEKRERCPAGPHRPGRSRQGLQTRYI